MDEYIGYENAEKSNKKQGSGIKGYQVFLLMLVSAVIGVAICLAVLIGGNSGFRLIRLQGEDKSALVSMIVDRIEKYYYFQDELPSEDEMFTAAAKGVVYSINDPYADFFTDSGYNDYRNELNGNYKGIGVTIALDPEGRGIVVLRAYVDNPAYNAGLRDRDIIISANGESFAGLDLDPCSGKLKGEDGSVVTVEVIRGEETLTLDITRGDVTVSRVFSERLDNNIGYICIEEFTGDAETAFDAQLDALLESGITSLIIDLRNNPGGSLSTVLGIADRVLGDCVITTLEGKTYTTPEVYRSTDEEKLEIPFIVLVNGMSASASEVFSGAIQDNGAAPLLGENTFGKGIVQTYIDLGKDLGYLKLTTDVYFTPNGSMIHGKGLAPDIEVELPEEYQGQVPYYMMNYYREYDTQLAAAIEYLTGK